MKHLIAALIACLFLSSFTAARQQQEWVTFSSPEGRFSLQFPKKPASDVKEVDSVVGKLTMYTYAASSSTVTYMASFADYPNVPEANRQMAVLDAVRDGVVSKLEARIYDETRISMEGNPGRQFLMTKTVDGSELIYHWRIYLIGRRLYQVAAAYYKRDSQSRELPKYFDSFQLLS
ncbi:MAG TPA: hypothetical protein VLA93_08125 [Pyrinomonadaceae bacterium]|nr:hypothetical protein [Pyrinomonadaceae bacterium]